MTVAPTSARGSAGFDALHLLIPVPHLDRITRLKDPMDQTAAAAGTSMLFEYTVPYHPRRNGNHIHARRDEVAGWGKRWPQHQ